jgi:hypothetical protein
VVAAPAEVQAAVLPAVRAVVLPEAVRWAAGLVEAPAAARQVVLRAAVLSAVAQVEEAEVVDPWRADPVAAA